MSYAANLQTAILADVSAAITGITTRLGAISAPAIPSYPYAFTVEPSEGSEPLEWGQQNRTSTVPLLLVWLRKDRTQEERFTDFEAFEAQLKADPTLGALVATSRVAEVIWEPIEDEERVWCVVTIEAQRNP